MKQNGKSFSELIRSQQKARVFLNQFAEQVTELENLSKQVREWMQNKNSDLKEAASSLAGAIESVLPVFASYIERTHASIADEPVGSEDQVATAKVIEFREKLAEERSKIRLDLAAQM